MIYNINNARRASSDFKFLYYGHDGQVKIVSRDEAFDGNKMLIDTKFSPVRGVFIDDAQDALIKVQSDLKTTFRNLSKDLDKRMSKYTANLEVCKRLKDNEGPFKLDISKVVEGQMLYYASLSRVLPYKVISILSKSETCLNMSIMVEGSPSPQTLEVYKDSQTSLANHSEAEFNTRIRSTDALLEFQNETDHILRFLENYLYNIDELEKYGKSI